MKKRVLATISAVVFVCASAASVAGDTHGWTGSYLCREELGGGIAFDDKVATWVGAALQPSDQPFVLSLTRTPDAIEKASRYVPPSEPTHDLSEFARDWGMDVYDVRVSRFGQNTVELCTGIDRYPDVELDAGTAVVVGEVVCITGVGKDQIRLDLGSMRFLRADLSAYVGAERTEFWPSIMGGTCARLN